ncbi:DUF3300 domain-containing protein, partial [Klebsiella pneumoniae]|nr:DUF3300 domain-containing protein [Klebsiella pneumoniae]
MTDVCYRTSAAIEADSTLTSVEPWDPSVKSLVAFPALLAMM